MDFPQATNKEKVEALMKLRDDADRAMMLMLWRTTPPAEYHRTDIYRVVNELTSWIDRHPLMKTPEAILLKAGRAREANQALLQTFGDNPDFQKLIERRDCLTPNCQNEVPRDHGPDFCLMCRKDMGSRE